MPVYAEAKRRHAPVVHHGRAMQLLEGLDTERAVVAEASAGADTVALLRRRHAEDFLFGGGYDDASAGPDA